MKKQVLFGVIIGAILVIGAVFLIGSGTSGPVRSDKVGGLGDVVPSKVVELKDGDSYDLIMGYVKQNINGKEIRMIAYNGSIPGPTIKVTQGSTVTINVINKTDIPTTLHPHGIRTENAYDGVPDMTQKEIKPGQSFAYKLTFPDTGIFWYHPHMSEEYAQGLGAYGNFLVTPS
jgi:FtsP/CotA-like multicopper oxidase with cupredoxin domain